MAAMCVAIVINSNPILHLVCVYVLWEQPTSTDTLGTVYCVHEFTIVKKICVTVL